MNSNTHGFEVDRPSLKGTKLLLKVIKAIIIVMRAPTLTHAHTHTRHAPTPLFHSGDTLRHTDTHTHLTHTNELIMYTQTHTWTHALAQRHCIYTQTTNGTHAYTHSDTQTYRHTFSLSHTDHQSYTHTLTLQHTQHTHLIVATPQVATTQNTCCTHTDTLDTDKH